MLSCLMAAPTVVKFGRRRYLARPMTIGGFAFLMRNGAISLGVDLDAGETLEWSDDRLRDWLFGDGADLVLYEGLRRDRPGWTLDDAAELLDQPDAAELFRDVFTILMSRSRFSAPEKGKGTDVAAAEWGKTLSWLARNAGALPADVAELTLDQLDMLLTDGACDEALEAANRNVMQERWLEAQRKLASAKAYELLEAGNRAEAEVTLASLGLAFTPESLAEYEAARAAGETTDGCQ